jgi:type I restriction enzyme, S subunit
MSEWAQFKLDDLAEIHNHKRVPLSRMQRAERQGPYPYYGASGIIDHVDDYLFDGEYVLVSEDGENLKSRKTPIAFKATDKFWVNNHAHILRGREPHINDLLIYYFQNLDLHPYITGAVQPKLNKANLLSIPIALPKSGREQEAITAVLSTLDDKIDLLHRQNKTLESMAQALFRHWFIDNAADNWEECHVRDFVRHQRQSVKPQSRPMEIFIHYSLPAFDNDKTPIAEMGSEIRSNKYKLTPFSILVSKLNPRFPRIWDIYFQPETNSICSTEFQIMEPKSREYYGFVSYLLKSDEAITELQMAASGTSGSHQRVKPADILNLSILIPNQKDIKQFSQMVEPNLAKIHSNRMQIRTLEKLRDTLLPKLMSGEVRVRQN